MIALDINAIQRGGVLARVPIGNGARPKEVRVTVRYGSNGDRVFDLRQWWANDDGEWCPGRRGWNGLSGAHLRLLGEILNAAGAVVPRAGARRSRQEKTP